MVKKTNNVFEGQILNIVADMRLQITEDSSKWPTPNTPLAKKGERYFILKFKKEPRGRLIFHVKQIDGEKEGLIFTVFHSHAFEATNENYLKKEIENNSEKLNKTYELEEFNYKQYKDWEIK